MPSLSSCVFRNLSQHLSSNVNITSLVSLGIWLRRLKQPVSRSPSNSFRRPPENPWGKLEMERSRCPNVHNSKPNFQLFTGAETAGRYEAQETHCRHGRRRRNTGDTVDCPHGTLVPPFKSQSLGRRPWNGPESRYRAVDRPLSGDCRLIVGRLSGWHAGLPSVCRSPARPSSCVNGSERQSAEQSSSRAVMLWLESVRHVAFLRLRVSLTEGQPYSVRDCWVVDVRGRHLPLGLTCLRTSCTITPPLPQATYISTVPNKTTLGAVLRILQENQNNGNISLHIYIKIPSGDVLLLPK